MLWSSTPQLDKNQNYKVHFRLDWIWKKQVLDKNQSKMDRSKKSFLSLCSYVCNFIKDVRMHKSFLVTTTLSLHQILVCHPNLGHLRRCQNYWLFLPILQKWQIFFEIHHTKCHALANWNSNASYNYLSLWVLNGISILLWATRIFGMTWKFVILWRFFFFQW